jgi:hypothetical protein
MERYFKPAAAAAAPASKPTDMNNQPKRKQADDNEHKEAGVAVVIARLPENKIAELWEHVKLNMCPAVRISATCYELAHLGGRYSLNNKGYVQIKTSTLQLARETNEKIQLHHLAIWHHPETEYRAVARQQLQDGKEKLEVSHLCNFKQCCNPEHMRLESSNRNKSRNYCVAFVQAPTNQWFRACEHQPPCVVTTTSHILALAGREL